MINFYFPVVDVRNNSTQPVVKTASTLSFSFAQNPWGRLMSACIEECETSH